MNIKKKLHAIKRKIKYIFLSEAEKKMISLSAKITQEYINSREFRRTMQKCGFDRIIKEMLHEWSNKENNPFY
jgi:hypothetical protein